MKILETPEAIAHLVAHRRTVSGTALSAQQRQRRDLDNRNSPSPPPTHPFCLKPRRSGRNVSRSHRNSENLAEILEIELEIG